MAQAIENLAEAEILGCLCLSYSCELQDADGSGYSQYGNMLRELAQHEAEMNVTVYKQIWNEPDLTSYFNYSAGGTTFFHGTNVDYNQMYEAASKAMAVCSRGC